MQLADQRAVVTRFGQALGHQLFMRRKVRIAVAVDMVRGRVTTGQKSGARRRADRTLGIGAVERHAVGHQRVDGVGADMRIAQRMDGVPALLVGAVPQNVGADCSHRRVSVRGDAGSLDGALPAHMLALEQVAKFCGCTRRHIPALRDFVAYLRAVQCLHQLFGHAGHNIGRRPGTGDEAEPGQRLEIRHAGFGQRRQRGQARRAFGRGGTDGHQLATF